MKVFMPGIPKKKKKKNLYTWLHRKIQYLHKAFLLIDLPNYLPSPYITRAIKAILSPFAAAVHSISWADVTFLPHIFHFPLRNLMEEQCSN